MKRCVIIWFIGFSFPSLLLNAQTKAPVYKFDGQITYQNTGKPFFPGFVHAETSSDVKTEPATGNFELNFDTKYPGHDITIVLNNKSKIPYEFVPAESAVCRMPDDAAKRKRIHLVIGVKGAWEANSKRWKLQYKDSIELRTKAKIAALEKRIGSDQIVFNLQKENLEAQRDSAINLSEKYADIIAQTDLSSADAIYRKAYYLFTHNQLDEVVKLLDPQKIVQHIDHDDQDKSNQIGLLMILARTKAMQLDFKSTSADYDLAFKKDQTNYYNGLEIAAFFKKFNQNQKAINIYQKIVNFTPSESDSVMVVGLTAETYAEHNNDKRAEEIFRQNLAYYLNAVKSGNNGLKPYLADTYFQLGVLLDRRHSYQASAYGLIKSKNIYDTLQQKDNSYRLRYIKSLSTLADVFMHGMLYYEAVTICLLAKDKNAEIYKDNPSSLDANEAMARSTAQMAYIYDQRNLNDKADSAYRSCISTYEKLASTNPNPNLYLLSEAKGNYSMFVFTNLKDPGRACDMMREVLNLDGKLIAEDAAAFQPLQAQHWNMLGKIYRKMSIASSADSTDKYFRLSLAVREKLAAADSLHFAGDYAAGLADMADLIQYKDYSNAIAYCIKAVRIDLDLTATTPDYIYEFGMVYNELAIIDENHKDLANAVAIHHKLFSANVRYGLPSKPIIYRPLALAQLIHICRIDQELSEETADSTYLINGRNFADSLSIYANGGDTNVQRQYLPFADYYQKYFSKIDRSTLEWTHNIFLASNLTDSIQSNTDTFKRNAWQAQIKSLVLRCVQLNITDNKNVSDRLYFYYNNLGWAALFAGRPDLAQTAAEKGLDLSTTDNIIISNLFLSYVYQNKMEEAKKLYITYKGQKSSDGRNWKDIFIKDLNDLQSAGITSSHAPHAKTLLTQ